MYANEIHTQVNEKTYHTCYQIQQYSIKFTMEHCIFHSQFLNEIPSSLAKINLEYL